MRLPRIAILLLLSVLATASQASDAIERARKVFQAYVTGYHAFDPGVVNLYSDEALIHNKRTYPDGQVRELSIPAPQYKDLVRNAMPLAQARGDRSQYNSATFAEETRGVRVNISRYSELKKHTSPMSLLIAPTPSGAWLILEERTESIP